MPHRDNLPVYEGMLRRPRLQALVRQGLQHPLLLMLAGPGYGKTQAVSSYLAQSDARILWLRLAGLDNLPAHFWDHLTHALNREFPDISADLRALEFPGTPAKMNAFLQLLRQSLGRQRVVWVFDDFGEITERKIGAFFSALVEAEPEGFSLVLISNVLARTESVAFPASKRFLILGKDLRFTREEIGELYAMYGSPLQADELDEIERYTEGWPLSLHLLALQHGQTPDRVWGEGRLTREEIALLFEERFYAAYPERQRWLLVKLSLLSTFTDELAADLYEGDKAELEEMRNHVFLTIEPATGRFFFHHMYHLFLQSKQYLLEDGEQQHVWRRAAAYYEKAGYYIDAIGYYRKCGDHVGMLNVFRDFVRLQHGSTAHGITSENAAFFLEHLDLLTPEEVRQYPVADYLRAVVYLNMLELDRAEVLFRDLERRLLDDGSPEALELLGDTYAITGALHMMRNQEDFGSYYEKAAGYLPNGTKLQNTKSLLTQNNNSFSMPDNLPGARERMERAVHYGVPWANKVLCGGMSGLEHVFSAEAAYLANQMEEARQHAWRAIYKAEANAQHDLACNGYCLLARVGLMQGDFAEMSRQIKAVEEYTARYNIGALKDIRDTALGWYYIKLRDLGRIPKSLLAQAQASRPVLAHDRSVIVYANYLINTGEYAKLIGMLEYPIGLYLSGGIWQDRISMYIMLAIGHYHLGNHDEALKALWEAYDMTYGNGLVTLFIEAEDHMRALVELARKRQDYDFAPEWLDLVHRQSASYTKRAAAVRSAYRQQNPRRATANNPLTPREMDVLRALAMGLTREEIAVRQYISVNTVKTFIRNIYTKLDAANRAEAVSISISRGYIDVAVP